MGQKKLEWDEKYSVGVKIIDDQHKLLFATINELMDAINTDVSAERLRKIMDALIEYKASHFSTEEKYFKEFDYEGAEEHIAEHQEFDKKLTALTKKYPEYTVEFAFELVDFLEDWLISHLMIVDQKYKECFREHGLK